MPDDSENKKAQPGWYVDDRWPGEQRRWDGTRWLDEWRPALSTTPATLMFIGVVFALVFAVLAALAAAVVDETAGWIMVAVGGAIAGTVFNVGMIAKAVEIGVRASRH